MKVKIEIDTTERYSSRKNLVSLIEMVLEECEGQTGQGSTAYKGDGGQQTCTYSLELGR